MGNYIETGFVCRETSKAAPSDAPSGERTPDSIDKLAARQTRTTDGTDKEFVWTESGVDALVKSGHYEKWGRPAVGSTVAKEFQVAKVASGKWDKLFASGFIRKDVQASSATARVRTDTATVSS